MYQNKTRDKFVHLHTTFILCLALTEKAYISQSNAMINVSECEILYVQT